MFSLLIKINEFGVKCDHLNTRGMLVCVCAYLCLCFMMYFHTLLSGFDGEIILFSSLLCTKSFALSLTYINIKVLQLFCFVFLSLAFPCYHDVPSLVIMPPKPWCCSQLDFPRTTKNSFSAPPLMKGVRLQ